MTVQQSYPGNESEPVAWRIMCTTSGATGYLYTEKLPFDPGPGVKVRREPEPLYVDPAQGSTKPFSEWRADLGLVLYNCEKFRATHAGAIVSAAAGRKVTGLDMEPWELCADTFLSDADAIIDFLRAYQFPSTEGK